MPSTAEVIEALRMFIATELLHDETSLKDLDLHSPLLDGFLDSLNTVQLLAFISDNFEVDVPPDGILPENFKDIASIARLVTELQDKRTRTGTR